jgi:hypothetical protein
MVQLTTSTMAASFQAVALTFTARHRTDVFAYKNNKTVAETVAHRRYAHLSFVITHSYSQAHDKPLGSFLLECKQAGDALYRRFLNAYGDAHYCTFSIQDERAKAQKGLYCFVVDQAVMYIGRCRDSFGKRFNQGYGVIHPKNCYLDGQATNCHLNTLIDTYSTTVQCYIYPLLDNNIIEQREREFIQWYKPIWNIALKGSISIP